MPSSSTMTTSTESAGGHRDNDALRRARELRQAALRRNAGSRGPSAAPQKRRAEEPPDDPRTQQTEDAEVVGETEQGTKRKASDAPDDPRLTGSGSEAETVNDGGGAASSSTDRAAGALTASQPYKSWKEYEDERREERNRWRLPGGESVADPPPGTDEAGDRPLYDQDAHRHAHGQNVGKPKLAESAKDSMCATCGKAFGSKNSLHRHLRDAKHHVRGAPPMWFEEEMIEKI